VSRPQKVRRQTINAERQAAKRALRDLARERREEDAAAAAAAAELKHVGTRLALQSVGERLGIPAERQDEFAERLIGAPVTQHTGHLFADVVHSVLDVFEAMELERPAADDEPFLLNPCHETGEPHLFGPKGCVKCGQPTPPADLDDADVVQIIRGRE
jgi:hypothetical protein